MMPNKPAASEPSFAATTAVIGGLITGTVCASWLAAIAARGTFNGPAGELVIAAFAIGAAPGAFVGFVAGALLEASARRADARVALAPNDGVRSHARTIDTSIVAPDDALPAPVQAIEGGREVLTPRQITRRRWVIFCAAGGGLATAARYFLGPGAGSDGLYAIVAWSLSIAAAGAGALVGLVIGSMVSPPRANR